MRKRGTNDYVVPAHLTDHFDSTSNMSIEKLNLKRPAR